MSGNGHALRFVKNGRDYERLLLEGIRRARAEILIEVYIFQYDDLGRRVLAALTDARARGVEVRCLIDGYGSHEIVRDRLDVLRDSPTDFRIYHPLPWPFSRFDRHNVGRLPSFFRLLLLANRRDHRKIILFDRRSAILGSRNIWDQSLVWNEASLVLEGPQVAEVRRSFEMVWARASNLRKRRQLKERLKPRAVLRSRHVLTNDGRRRKRWHRAHIFKTLASARERIWITTPYLNPQVPFIRQLKRKARQGLDIRILLPARSDVVVSKWLSETIYHDLLNAGIRIYEHTDQILHAKALLTESQVIIGSTNLNYRSLRRDLEIDYASDQRALLEQVQAWQEDNFRNALEITSIDQVRFLWFKKLLRVLLIPLKYSI